MKQAQARRCTTRRVALMMLHCRQGLATQQEAGERRLGDRRLGEQEQAVQLKLKFEIFEFRIVSERALGKLNLHMVHRLSTVNFENEAEKRILT